MLLVKLTNICKVYGNEDNKVEALKDINLLIDEGEFVAIMGASGSGKSTLMHVIGFLDRPTSGQYFFEGENITHLSDNNLADIRNSKIGFVFQAFNLLPRTSALDNTTMPLLYAGKFSAAQMRQRGLGLLKRVDLGNRIDHHPSQLSGGQQQRVAIARALVNDPKIIFADEPTGNLDSKSSIEIMELFKQLNSLGHTLVFVTHEENIAAYAHRVIKLKDGQIISDNKSTG